MPNPTRENATRLSWWLLGIFLSTLFSLIISQFWVSSALWYKYDQTLDKWFPREGTYRYRKEGWGVSHIGKYGINGIADVIGERSPKFLIWGDSFVEAYHVDDPVKLAQQSTIMLRQQYGLDMLGVAFGFTGHSLADYILEIPKLADPVQPLLHVIVIDDLRDTFPADLVAGDFSFAQFLAQPTYHIKASTWTPPFNRVEQFWDQSRLFGAKAVVGNLLFQLRGLRLRPGPVAPPVAQTRPETPENPGQIWDFILKRLRDTTDKPILMVYLPKVPYLHKGQVLFEEDADSTLLALFAGACTARRIDLISMEQPFVEFYRQHRAFPRGFPNTVPGQGHLNADGHRLVAAAIAAYVHARTEENSAVLPD